MMVLAVTPTLREARALPGACVAGAGARCGPALARVLDEQRPSAVVLAGVAGGLDPSLAPGAVVLVREARAEGVAPVAPDPALFAEARAALRRAGIAFVSAPALTVAGPIAAPDAKRDAWNATGAAVIDMETQVMASLLAERGVPWLAVRTVLDPARDTLPRELARWQDEADNAAAVRAALRHPASWPAFMRLAIQERRALRSLRRTVPVVSATLAASREAFARG
jgi:adenosylhomocysteine nucleosidase